MSDMLPLDPVIKCDICGTHMTLIHREPHPRIPAQELKTFKCVICKQTLVVSAPAHEGGKRTKE